MHWKDEILNSITTIDQLKNHYNFSKEEIVKHRMVIERFPMQVTPYYFNLINFDDPDDPIKNIIIPRLEEFSEKGSYDTSGEALSTKIKGLQHKYSTTALVLLDNVCASYCRFCFRKRLMNRNIPTKEILTRFDSVYKYIASHKEIDNVLISGGDPFMFPDEKIEYILKKLRQLEHIKIIRIGTRMLAFLPFRFTDNPRTINILAKYNLPDKKLYIVSHFNHPRELTPEALKAINALNSQGIIICNQTVLLRGVNDNPSVIRELFNNLATCGVEPYYLFQCRPVKSSLHFQISLNEGYAIYEKAKKGMSGLVKRVRYIMSHFLGKIEILNIEDREEYIRGYFKFHQARYPDYYSKFFSIDLPPDTCWLDKEMLEKHLSQKEKRYKQKIDYRLVRNLRLTRTQHPLFFYNR